MVCLIGHSLFSLVTHLFSLVTYCTASRKPKGMGKGSSWVEGGEVSSGRRLSSDVSGDVCSHHWTRLSQSVCEGPWAPDVLRSQEPWLGLPFLGGLLSQGQGELWQPWLRHWWDGEGRTQLLPRPYYLMSSMNLSLGASLTSSSLIATIWSPARSLSSEGPPAEERRQA